MFNKILNSLTPFEKFSVKIFFYTLMIFMVSVGFAFGFRFLNYSDDFYNFLGLVMILICVVITFLTGVGISKIDFKEKSDEEE